MPVCMPVCVRVYVCVRSHVFHRRALLCLRLRAGCMHRTHVLLLSITDQATSVHRCERRDYDCWHGQGWYVYSGLSHLSPLFASSLCPASSLLNHASSSPLTL